MREKKNFSFLLDRAEMREIEFVTWRRKKIYRGTMKRFLRFLGREHHDSLDEAFSFFEITQQHISSPLKVSKKNLNFFFLKKI